MTSPLPPARLPRIAATVWARARTSSFCALALAALFAAPFRVAEGGGARGATVSAILAEVRAARAPAVLINVWATWCDPCREEMPELLRFYRAHRDAGLRLVLLSADDEDAGPAIQKLLADAATKAGWKSTALDATVYLKQDGDMKFIDALDPAWSGALPATFLFDRDGHRLQSWLAPVTGDELERAVGPRLTKPRGEDKRSPQPDPKPDLKTPRRKP